MFLWYWFGPFIDFGVVNLISVSLISLNRIIVFLMVLVSILVILIIVVLVVIILVILVVGVVVVVILLHGSWLLLDLVMFNPLFRLILSFELLNDFFKFFACQFVNA